MKDYVKELPEHNIKYIGENDLYLEIFKATKTNGKAPLLFVHGAYTGSWMWSKYIPHFVENGWDCYVMNLRSHYRSRSMDLTEVVFEDYLVDVLEIINECNKMPILIGFSLGGILCQKLAEAIKVDGMVLIDSAISKEVNEVVPYAAPSDLLLDIIEPAPKRIETSTIDETKEDIEFQKKYNSMESTKVFNAIGCWMKGVPGISIDSSKITSQVLVIKSVNSEEKEKRGEAEANHLNGKYIGFKNTTHTGLLIGSQYQLVVNTMLQWLDTI